MSIFIDKMTAIVNRAIDILILKQPLRTSMGIVVGLALDFLVQLFLPALKKFATIADFSSAPLWGWIITGILVAHIPTLISLMKPTPLGHEGIGNALDLIKKTDLPQAEKILAYRRLVGKILDNIVLDKKIRQNVQDLQNKIEKGEAKPSKD